ncbi:hypothetical protein BLA9940_04450 [Burkholderia aenigmatica]|uniref:inovirus-type Gp2 protein n=1 Tax=Burkholderia aenigmatica TaxID=2015348 RepID=UPI001453EC0A|nr:inovirus-type Gp2 protein [Burkholderia aenigmatica]VWC75902.1 hypothetical protein BLA9940_04450 [Burkholderia aenigmatica]
MDKSTEDHEALEVFARFDERTNLEIVDAGEHRRSVVSQDDVSQHLFEIEGFVGDVVEKEKWKGFVEKVRYNGSSVIQECYLGKHYYGHMNDWLDRYSDRYCYSSHVGVFYDVCKELGLIGQYPILFGLPRDRASVDGARYMDVFNALIEQIRIRCNSRAFKERERLRELNAKKNSKRVLALEEAMFSQGRGRSRWLVLSLTLRYKDNYKGSITPEVIQQHRASFFAARRHNVLMSGIKNYVWTIEQGEDTGLHMHVILFYSAEHNHDVRIAQRIGEYWVDVATEGKGAYWNSNADWCKKNYETRGHGIGVGQINRTDGEKRKALRINLVYLAKAEQYLMVKGADRIRTFGTGQVPKKMKMGRPRIGAAESE